MSSAVPSDESPPFPHRLQIGMGSLSSDTEKSLLELLDAAPLACIAVNKTGQVTDWNHGAEQLFGWSKDDVVSQQFTDCLPTFLVPPVPQGKEMELSDKNGESLDLKVWGKETEHGSVLLAADIREKKFLERALIEAAEREQRRIGQELHDHLCQHLLGAAFAAKALAGALDREGSTHAVELHDLARLINDSVTQARDISRGLHPVELDSAGLMSALQELANRVSHTVTCTFMCKETILINTPQVSLNAYRIAQDAVANAMQNTGATKIQIRLFTEDESVCLEIKDNGNTEGELSAEPDSTAVRTLQYRAQAMKAQLFIDFEPRKGTRTTCIFPQAHE